MVLREKEIGQYYFEIYNVSGRKYISKIITTRTEKFICITTNRTGESVLNNFDDFEDFEERRLATPEEIEHFNQCEKAGKYVSYKPLKPEIEIWY